MSPAARRSDGDRAAYCFAACCKTKRNCAICVLLCTTRESSRLWEKAGLFNLRLSSDAPNLQVENEETIEALSARTEALLDRIQQRFSFGRSLHAFVYRCFFHPLAAAASHLGFTSTFPRSCGARLRAAFAFPHFLSLISLSWREQDVRCLDGIGYDPSGQVPHEWFFGIIDWSRPMSRQ